MEVEPESVDRGSGRQISQCSALFLCMWNSKPKKKNENAMAKLEHQLHLAKHAPDAVVDLSDCTLEKVPSGVYSLCRVLLKEVLILHTNELSTLKDDGSYESFGRILSLRILDVHNNKLTVMPSELGNLRNLQILNLENNQLHDLPKNIGCLKSLQTLNVKRNKIKVLPTSICELASLRALDVSDNMVTVIPEGFYSCRCIESLIVDINRMVSPPSDICKEGTSAMMKFLCQQAGAEYVTPSAAVLNVLKVPETSDELNAVEKRSHSFACSQDAITSAVWKYEQLKDDKRRQQLELERTMLQAQSAQAQQIANSNQARSQILRSIADEQSTLDAKICILQQQKDLDKHRLLDIISHTERHSDNLIKELLKFNEQARRSESMLDEEERRMKEELFLKNRREEYERLRKQDVEQQIQNMMGQLFTFDQLRLMYEQQRALVVDKARQRDMEQTDSISQTLSARDKIMKQLLQQLVQEESFQKEAVEMLMLQRDAKTNRINSQIELIERELAQMTNLELKQREYRVAEQQQLLVKQRAELTKLLMQLLIEKDARAWELKRRLLEMEQESATAMADYWLVQYQRLLDNKPQQVVDMETCLDSNLVKLLNGAGAQDYIPAFARHKITLAGLLALTEDDLQRLGIYQVGIRKTILAAITDLMHATGRSPPASPIHPAPSAPPTISATVVHMEIECVVCMNDPATIIFVPCGHVCCCVKCSLSLSQCPMCRADVNQKLDLKSTQPSAPPQVI